MSAGFVFLFKHRDTLTWLSVEMGGVITEALRQRQVQGFILVWVGCMKVVTEYRKIWEKQTISEQPNEKKKPKHL